MDGVNNPSISGSGYPVSQDYQTKTLSRGTKADAAQGGAPAAGPDPALAQWYQQAYAYYNAVASGQEAPPDPAAWQNFMAQLNWAAGQLGYGPQQWDPSMGGQQGAMPGQVPAGATLGTQNNVVYNSIQANINAEGDARVQDVWSNDININIPSLSAKVTSELTTDPRFQPGEQVLKIVSHDPATGVDTVYIIHDYADAKVKVNTPVKTQFTDSSAFAGISWSQYQQTGGTGGSGSHPDASVPGEVVSTDTNGNTTIKYAPEFYDPTSTIDLFANPNDPGKTNTSIISYANINISAKGDDDVVIIKDQPNPGDVLVKVVHSKGITGQESEDDYVVKNGYQTLNVNGNPASVHFESAAGPAGTDGVPTGYKGVTLNGGATTGTGAGAIDADSVLQGLESGTGRNDAQILSALNASGYGFATIDDFKKAISDGTFPGTPPDNKLLKFLGTVDPELNGDIGKLYDQVGGSDDSAKKAARDAVGSRLMALLQTLYPNDILNNTSTSDQKVEGKIGLNGTNYTWQIWMSDPPTLQFK